MHVLFIDTVHHSLWDGLVSDGHVCVEGYSWGRDEILSGIKDFEGVVIRSRTRIDKEFLDAASMLKFIARSGAGMENIDTAYAHSKGVKCLNSPEGNRDAVAEHAAGMLLMLLNRLSPANQEVRKGEWNREANRGHELNEMTVALIGYGTMGRAFARRLTGFGCEVIAYDKYLEAWPDENARRTDMNDIYDKADVVSLHVPLTDETRMLADKDFFFRFKKNIRILNTARGGCLSLEALAEAMKSGKVLGACLDVLEYEDSSFEGFSLVQHTESSVDWQYLVGRDDVIFSPHIAGWTHESYRKLSEVLLQKVRMEFC